MIVPAAACVTSSSNWFSIHPPMMDAVDALTKEKTIIMIAHRLKTVRHADQIVVVEKGRIAQQGTHEQLMKQEGIYKRFVDARQQAVSWKLAH